LIASGGAVDKTASGRYTNAVPVLFAIEVTARLVNVTVKNSRSYRSGAPQGADRRPLLFAAARLFQLLDSGTLPSEVFGQKSRGLRGRMRINYAASRVRGDVGLGHGAFCTDAVLFLG
jgi:hypothetical protein